MSDDDEIFGSDFWDSLKDTRCKRCNKHYSQAGSFLLYYQLCEECAALEGNPMNAATYESCPACFEARTKGDISKAVLTCYTCKGKGFRRTRESYVCNGCGDNLCIDFQEGSDRFFPHGLVDAVVGGGYHSIYLRDCTQYTFSLCEKCLRGQFNSFKIPPKISGTMGEFETYEEDRDGHEEFLWRETTNGPKERVKAGLCSASRKCEKPAIYRNFRNAWLGRDTFCEEHSKRPLEQPQNYELIAIEKLAHLPSSNEDLTTEQKLEVANLYLDMKMPNHLYYERFIAQPIAEMLKPGHDTQDGLSGIWVPSVREKNVVESTLLMIVIPNEIQELTKQMECFKFINGWMYFAPQKKIIGKIRELNKSTPVIQTKDSLCKIYEEEE